MQYTERYYQRDARAAINSGFFEYRTGVLQLGTGAGKTSIIAKDIKEHLAENPANRCLFVADQDELIAQPLRSIQRVGGIIAAVDQGKNKAPAGARCVVASAQTISQRKRLERFRPDHFSRIYVDEAHRGSDRNKRIYDYYTEAQTCGATATPFRQGLRDLSKYYETVFYKHPMLDLYNEGFAVPPHWLQLPVEIDLAKCATGRTPDGVEYKAEDVDSTITPYLEEIARLVALHAKGRHIIAYLPLIKTSMEFAKALRNAGVTAMHVDGQSKDREQIIEGFSRGRFSCLCNSGVVSTGVDIPIADCFLPLRPMKSVALYQQSAGRCFRTLPGLVDHLPEREQSPERCELIEWSDKPNALLFDLLWQHDMLGASGPSMLVAESEEEAKDIAAVARKKHSEQDLLEIKKRVQADKEAQLVRALEAAAAKADFRRSIPYQQAAFLIGSRSLLEYEPEARWELDKPSEKQLACLIRWGIDPGTVETKGAAKKLMDVMFHRINYRFATVKQLRLIAQINEKRDPEARVQNPHQLTIAEASAIIDTDMAARKVARLAAAAQPA